MIGPGTSVRGTITGDEDLVVEGQIEGAVRLSKDLTIAEGARVAAEVEAQTVILSGRLEGKVQAAVSLVVDETATLVGEVRTARISIADGARFKGRVHMDFDIPGGAPASPPAGRRR